MRRYIPIGTLVVSLVPLFVQAATLTVLTPRVQSGEAVIAEFNEAPKAIRFEGKSVTPFPYHGSWRAIIPLPLKTSIGTSTLSVQFSNGERATRSVRVLKKPQPVVKLPPPPKLGLSDTEIADGLAAASALIKRAIADTPNVTRFISPFALPLAGAWPVTSPFGEIRKTGVHFETHLGTDFGAPKGTPVLAINSGIVKSAAFDPVYGNSVIVDHGRGIYSIYLHLDTMAVAAGDVIAKKFAIGTVGDSGLASAAHLHLSIKINGISVDPVRFISSFR